MRASLTLGGLMLVVACDSRAPSSPAPIAPSPVVAPPLVAPVASWTLTGQIVDTITRQPVAGVRLLPFAVTTTSNGLFRIDGTGQRNAERVTLEKTGYITRETTISGTTQNPIVDLIGDTRGSFSIDFYRQLVRNGYEKPKNLEPLRRWTSAPQIYIDTTTPANVSLLDADLHVIDRTIRGPFRSLRAAVSTLRR